MTHTPDKPDVNGNDIRVTTEYDKNPWPVVLGLVISILGWIGIFCPFADPDVDGQLQLQCYVLMAMGAIGAALCFFFIKRAPGMGLIGIITGATLLLTLLLSLIGLD